MGKDELVGKRITAYWNNKKWYPGTVKRAIQSSKGTHTVQYDDESKSIYETLVGKGKATF
jgi:hypothetical protein